MRNAQNLTIEILMHWAKFGSYSIMDLVNNRILDIQLV